MSVPMEAALHFADVRADSVDEPLTVDASDAAVVARARTGDVEAFGARRCAVDVVTVKDEHVDETLADGLLVFYDQYVYPCIHQALRLALRHSFRDVSV